MSNDTSTSSVDRFRGPNYLTRFDPDRQAMERLGEIPSETARRLIRYSRGGYPGILSGEDFLAPLAAAQGDVVLRSVDSPGSQWIWWRGNPIDEHFYGRLSTLPHYHDHKPVSRRKANADTLAEYLTGGGPVIPVHIENVPKSVWECLKNDRPYRNRRNNEVEDVDGGGS